MSSRNTPGSSSDAPVAVAASEARSQDWSTVVRDVVELTKPEISFLVTVSALAGFLLGSPDSLDVWVLTWTLLGVALCAGGAGILNHVMEVRFDAQMKRTADRPLPDGRLDVETTRTIGLGMVFASVGILCPLVNPLTSILAALTAGLYLFVYTPMKRTTKWNTLVGTIPGALPALGGYTAATGTFGAAGWAIFAVLVFWQMPHFFSLAWMYRKDYARGNYAMLPVLEPDGESTARQMILFTALLLIASLIPTWLGASGWLYAAGVAPLGVWFLWTTIKFYSSRTGKQARSVLKASIVYVPVLVLLIGLDWTARLWLG